MSYAPKKVFILENGKYVEITNEEHQHRKNQDREYREKYFIPVHGCLMKVTYEEYKDFYQNQEHQKYLKKRDKIYGLILFGELTELIIAAQNEDGQQKIETQECQERVQKLKELIQLLDKKDQSVINAIFLKGSQNVKLPQEWVLHSRFCTEKRFVSLKKLNSLAKLLYLDEKSE